MDLKGIYMKGEWVTRQGHDNLILFFNGWGMDAHAIKHLNGSFDVWMFYDYRTLEPEHLPETQNYRSVYIVGWSMGVWAASQVFSGLRVKPVACIAINGTERPVNNTDGIPENVYLLTEKGLTEKGRDKFFSRMLNGPEERESFQHNLPERVIEEQKEELTAIRELSITNQNTLKWDKALISEKDIIFPVQNQYHWWNGKTETVFIDSGHYPFYILNTWESIIHNY